MVIIDPKKIVVKKPINKKLIDDLVKQGTLIKKVDVNDNRRDIFLKKQKQ